jgi:hypothetical protein
MGFALVNGILGYLKSVLPRSVQSSQLHSLAERIAVGDLTFDQTFPENISRSREIIHAALTHGFGLVMLYGGVCAWTLAAASFLTFGARRVTHQREDQRQKEALSCSRG